MSGSDDKTLRLWDTVSGTHLNTLEGHSYKIRSVAFSPDGTHIVSGSYDNTLRLWDAVSGTPLHTLEGYSGPATSAAFSDYLSTTSGSSDDNIQQRNTVGGMLISVNYTFTGFHIAFYRSQRLLHEGWVDILFTLAPATVLDSCQIPR
jgi:WD40 repeat protein